MIPKSEFEFAFEAETDGNGGAAADRAPGTDGKSEHEFAFETGTDGKNGGRKMDLSENMRNMKPEEMSRLDLDTFGKIMDEFIEQSRCGLAVTKEEGETEWTVHGSGCGPVMDFYIFLNALEPIYMDMLEAMGGRKAMDPEKLARSLCQEVQKSLLAAAKEG